MNGILRDHALYKFKTRRLASSLSTDRTGRTCWTARLAASRPDIFVRIVSLLRCDWNNLIFILISFPRFSFAFLIYEVYLCNVFNTYFWHFANFRTVINVKFDSFSLIVSIKWKINNYFYQTIRDLRKNLFIDYHQLLFCQKSFSFTSEPLHWPSNWPNSFDVVERCCQL